MKTEGKIERQAVVVIHGIGEQRPMDTLREFVTGIKQTLEANDELEKASTVRSKPDSIGDIYETVRLSMDSTANRPITDFYEFYWAHNMRGTQFKYMGPWIVKLVGTKLSDVPDHLKKVWRTVWGLILVLPILFLAGFLVWQYFVQPLIPALILSGMGVCFLFIFGFFKGKFLDIAGDAGRYFTPTPDNIMERSNIRRQGIAFLQKLHTTKCSKG